MGIVPRSGEGGDCFKAFWVGDSNKLCIALFLEIVVLSTHWNYTYIYIRIYICIYIYVLMAFFSGRFFMAVDVLARKDQTQIDMNPFRLCGPEGQLPF